MEHLPASPPSGRFSGGDLTSGSRLNPQKAKSNWPGGLEMQMCGAEERGSLVGGTELGSRTGAQQSGC